jgi:hypothetical protein
MRTLSPKWVPKCLNADEKVNDAIRLSNFWDFFRRDPSDFLSRSVTWDESWYCPYDPEAK